MHTRKQVVIFVKSVQRCIALAQLLVEQNFPAIAIHRGMPQEERWVGDGEGVLYPWKEKDHGEKRLWIFFSFPLSQRLSRYQQFKDFQRRILVATNLFGRGMDIERVNIAFNYDMPEDSDTYLHRVSPTPTSSSQWPLPLPYFLLPLCLMFSSLLFGIFLLWGLQSYLPFLFRWLEQAGLAPRVWPSRLCQMRMMPRSLMMCKIALRSILVSCQMR